MKTKSGQEKWEVLEEYLKGEKSLYQIAEDHGVTQKAAEHFIATTYRRFQNMRESRMLVRTQGDRQLQRAMVAKYVDSEHINRVFLDRLSEEGDPLSDYEVLFAEFLVELGNGAKAVQKSKLDVGLNKQERATYVDACKLRAFYLKRKPNVLAYIHEVKRRNLFNLEDGKEYIQSHLINLIEQAATSSSSKSVGTQLRAIEHLARTIGAFEDKVTLEHVNGDDPLDKILEKARDARVIEVQ